MAQDCHGGRRINRVAASKFLSEDPKVQKDDTRDRYLFLNLVWIK